ncbi:hypothetical protein B7Z00_04345 [Candidatus Saccharibacteria bacterium 32-50-10]|nr:MAG: hypothetical protein B7Z00_04345 [Candidatus Saccharibacteria bacterium 32-50-10]
MIESDTVFGKIIRGELPSHKIYEDDQTLAFLNIYPSTTGHTLVIPKVAVENVWDLSDEDYQNLMITTKKVARHLREVLGVARIGQKIIGVDVPHAHVHLIPFDDAADYYNRESTDEPDHSRLAELAQKLYFTD